MHAKAHNNEHLQLWRVGRSVQAISAPWTAATVYTVVYRRFSGGCCASSAPLTGPVPGTLQYLNIEKLQSYQIGNVCI